ncbi:hypothetical protein AVEN_179363-1 [Araneus ventricosus]|uniref:C2H2-type domain-containing protein n=1 Tax=Araneus ventricosus TaxID=182803 RepID=A0A4Y2H3D9_ARAVE|nr:hypothetical protein AVEN_179363-1 [Araneus ventricosus]
MYECPKSSTNLRAFKTHVYRNHRSAFTLHKHNALGRKTYNSLFDISKHLKCHLDQNKSIMCPFIDCEARYKIYSSFKSHLSRKHFYHSVVSEKVNDLTKDEESFSSDTNNFVSDNLNDSNFDIDTLETDFETKLKQHVALLLLKAQEKHMLPLSTTQKLLQDFNSLCEMQTDYITDKIKTNVVSLGITANSFLKLNSILKENCISKSIDSLSTNYKRMHYYETELQTFFPIEYPLGSNIFNKTCSFQYVSILSTLKFLLMQDNVFQQVINPIGNSDNNVVSSFNDGKFAKSHLLFSTNQEALQINLFCDEFEVCNPLGVHRKTHKILAFYYILGNIYPEFRSCVDNIQLLILVKSTYVKKFGINMIVEPLIKDLNILASHGISVRDKTFVGSLSFISGDNLGSNMIGGFVESFSNKVNYYCRTCLCTKTEVQNIFSDENISLRTPQNYEQHVTELLTDNTKDSLYGIKRSSPFNSNLFHVTHGLPPDIAHDMLEGVEPYEVSLILTFLIKTGVISLDYINRQIETWPYGPLDSIDRPALIPKKCKISQTAARMWTLLRLLPLMCATIIPEDNLHWKLFIDLKEIIELVFAPILTVDYIAYLRIRINEHLQFFKELYPEKLIIPKQHFLIHYPLHLLNFGPLRNCWTLRFEAKHYYFKKLAVVGQNYKNITLTLANRHQLRQAYQATHSNGYLQCNRLIGTIKEIELVSIQPKTAQVVVKEKKSSWPTLFSFLFLY